MTCVAGPPSYLQTSQAPRAASPSDLGGYGAYGVQSRGGAYGNASPPLKSPVDVSEVGYEENLFQQVSRPLLCDLLSSTACRLIERRGVSFAVSHKKKHRVPRMHAIASACSLLARNCACVAW